MAVVHKTFAAKVTPAAKDSGDPEGTFEAIVSVFGNKDHGGDVVEAGAFAKTIAEWVIKGQPIPLVWSHQYQDVENFIGEIIEIKEIDEGLYIKAVYDLDHPKAARIYKLMKRGLLTEFSWSGLVREYEWLEDDEDDWWPGMKILDVDLWEAGPCFKGANPDTELLSIKSDGRVDGRLLKAKAGRVLSQQNLDSLTAARDAITKVIDAAVPAGDEDEDQEPAEDGGDTDAEKSAPQTTTSTEVGKHSQALLELITTTNL